jgi:GT2 family glycosyltransferase
MTTIDVSIIIVNWNVEKLLRDCLRSIYENTKKISFEVILIDNASHDGSVEMVKKEFPHVHLIANTDNAGFTKANNQGIRIAKGRLIMLLNPDTELLGNAVLNMVHFMDAHKDCGALGAELKNTDGSLQRSCKTFPSLEVTLYNSLFLDSLFPSSQIFGKHYMTWWDFNEPREVDQPMGSALMIRREVMDSVGMFDENIFIWFDEVDLCYRIKHAGWKIFFTPSAQIKHHLSKSFKQWKSVKQMINGTLLYKKARGYFFRKHYGLWTIPILYLFDLLQIAVVLGILYGLLRLIGLIIGRF